jgi:ABC-type sugar transport system ATPase subunit
MPDIRLADIRKSFANGAVGLHSTSLHISGGSYFVLCGPSGSGKTTLLRLIAGLETPGGGTIHFGDRRIDQLPPHERHLAYVSQRTALYPDRDVRGNIAAGLEFEQKRLPRSQRLSSNEIEKRVREAAERLSIAKLLANRPHELSGGEQRRVMLARAMVRRAQIWLLDEPLSHLDAPLAEKLSQDLHLLQRQSGHTIIHVTHDPIEAMALADRVGLLGGGRILQTGQPGEVYAQPGSRTVAFHFGRPSINLIDGRSDGTAFSARGWLRVACAHSGDVTLGVRPEDVSLYSANEFVAVGEGDVTESRQVDSRMLVTVRGPEGIEIRGIANELPNGRVTVFLRSKQLHWFDTQTGERINT